MLIGESNITSKLLIFLNILAMSRDWDQLFCWCTDYFGLQNVIFVSINSKWQWFQNNAIL